MKLKKICCIIVLIISNFALNAQEISPKYLRKSFKDGSLVLNDFTKLDAVELSFEKDSVLYNSENGNTKRIAYSNLQYVRFKSGNNLVKGATTGFFVGGLTGLGGVLMYNYNNTTLNDYVISGSVGCLIGVAVGATIGYLVPKMETVFFNHDKISQNLKLQIEPLNVNTLQCKIVYSF